MLSSGSAPNTQNSTASPLLWKKHTKSTMDGVKEESIRQDFPLQPRLAWALWTHTGQKLTQSQSCSDPTCSWQHLPTSHGVASQQPGSEHTQCTPSCHATPPAILSLRFETVPYCRAVTTSCCGGSEYSQETATFLAPTSIPRHQTNAPSHEFTDSLSSLIRSKPEYIVEMGLTMAFFIMCSYTADL